MMMMMMMMMVMMRLKIDWDMVALNVMQLLQLLQ